MALAIGLMLACAGPAFAGNGEIDTTFGSSGIAPSGGVLAWNAMTVMPDGRILVAGGLDSGALILARYLPDGQADPSFTAGTHEPTAVAGSTSRKIVGTGGVFPESIALTAGGTITVAGTAVQGGVSRGFMARFGDDGAATTSFGTSGVLTVSVGDATTVGAMVLDSSGRLVLAGSAKFGAVTNVLVARYTAAGAPDVTFNTTGVPGLPPPTGDARSWTAFAAGTNNFGAAEDAVIDSSNRIVVVGSAAVAGGSRHFMLARLGADAQLDGTFASGGVKVVQPGQGFGADPRIAVAKHVGIDGQGRLVVVGDESAGGHRGVDLQRYTSAGVTDNKYAGGSAQTFDTAQDATSGGLLVRPDGSFVRAGRARVGGVDELFIQAYNTAGDPDTTFNPTGAVHSQVLTPIGTGNSDTHAFAITGSGRPLVAGSVGDHTMVARLGGDGVSPIARASFSYDHGPSTNRVVRPGQPVQFTGSASSDADGHIVSYRWDFDGDGGVDSTDPSPVHAYPTAGVRNATLSVTDDDGLRGVTTVAVGVAVNTPPPASFDARRTDDPNDSTPRVSHPVVLTAFSFDQDGVIADYRWDLDGNGSFETDTGSSNTATFTPLATGTRQIGLQTRDDEGATTTASQPVTISPSPCTDGKLDIRRAHITTNHYVDSPNGSCFRETVVKGSKLRTTILKGSAPFSLSGLHVTPKGEMRITKFETLVNGKVTETYGKVSGPAHVEGTYKGSKLLLRDGQISWTIPKTGNTLDGFAVDKNAAIGGLLLTAPSPPVLNADGSSTLQAFPNAPPELKGAQPAKPLAFTFSDKAKAAADAAFTFELGPIPLGPTVILNKLKITAESSSTWTATVDATVFAGGQVIQAYGSLAFIDNKVKKISLIGDADPGIVIGLVVINKFTFSIDFGPKVAEDPTCVRHVGKQDITPYEFYDYLDAAYPGFRPFFLKNYPTGPLFHKLFIDWGQPSFALCGGIGLSVAGVINGQGTLGYAYYPPPRDYGLIFAQADAATIADLITASVDIKLTTAGYLAFRAGVGGDYPKKHPWISWNLRFAFEYYKAKFNAEAHAHVRIIPLDIGIGADLLASNKGVQGCAVVDLFFFDWTPGARAKWGDFPTLIFQGCDVADTRVVVNGSSPGDFVIGEVASKGQGKAAAGAPVLGQRPGVPLPVGKPVRDTTLVRATGGMPRAKAAQAMSGPQKVTVAAHATGATFAVVGAGAPPHVILHGPKGETIDSGSGLAPVMHPIYEGAPGYIAAKNHELPITEIAVDHPSAGTWTFEPAPDSSRIVQIAQGRVLPTPSAKGAISGRGQTRTLSYTITDLPKGSHVDFSEVGQSTGAIIGRAAANGAGRLTFHPSYGAAEPRDIQAMIYDQDGFLSTKLKLATYRAPAPPRAAVSRIRFARRGSTLTFTWRHNAIAKRYLVTVRTSKGRRFMIATKKPTAAVRALRTGDVVTVTVKGIDARAASGRAVSARYKLAKAKPKPKKVRGAASGLTA